MRKLLILLALLALATNALAVDRIIDPEIPVNPDFLDFEQDAPDLIESSIVVLTLSLGTISFSIFLLIFIFVFIKIGLNGILS